MSGLYHPCGAYNVTVAGSGSEGLYASDGSIYVTEDITNLSGAMRVNVVSGSLSGSTPQVITTVFDQALTTNDDGWGGYTVINPFLDSVNAPGGIAQLLPATGQFIRLTLQFHNLGNGSTAKLYVGQSGGGNIYSFTGNQVNVTFSGLDTITGDGSTTLYTSDWIQLGELFDNTVTYVIAFQLSGSNCDLKTWSNNMYFKGGVADAATTNKTGYGTQTGSGPVTKIEISTTAS